MGTTTETRTVKLELDACNPSTFNVALKLLKPGTLLGDLSAMTVETLVLDASLQAKLSKAPIGPVLAAKNGVTNKPQTQLIQGQTLGASQFSVNYSTRVLTAETTDFNDAESIDVVYLGLTKDTTGAAGSSLKEMLAKEYGRV